MNSLTDSLNRLPELPAEEFSSYGEVEVVEIPRIQQIAGGYLARNWVAIPHVTHHGEADVTEVEEKRRLFNEGRERVKISLPSIVIKAIVAALRQFPRFNASLDASGAKLICKKYFNIGVAVDTPRGLVAPVVKGCDEKSALAISEEIAGFAEKARGKGIPYESLRGGCFTLSALGADGGLAFTPIINAPEVAILGISGLQWKPTRGPAAELVWRRFLPLSLSYDHRVINGADAARFVAYLAAELSTAAAFMPDRVD